MLLQRTEATGEIAEFKGPEAIVEAAHAALYESSVALSVVRSAVSIEELPSWVQLAEEARLIRAANTNARQGNTAVTFQNSSFNLTPLSIENTEAFVREQLPQMINVDKLVQEFWQAKNIGKLILQPGMVVTRIQHGGASRQHIDDPLQAFSERKFLLGGLIGSLRIDSDENITRNFFGSRIVPSETMGQRGLRRHKLEKGFKIAQNLPKNQFSSTIQEPGDLVLIANHPTPRPHFVKVEGNPTCGTYSALLDYRIRRS